MSVKALLVIVVVPSEQDRVAEPVYEEQAA